MKKQIRTGLMLACLAGVIPAGAEAQDEPITGYFLFPVATGLNAPLGVTGSPDGSGRLFIVSQQGKVVIREAAGSLRATPFLDLSSLISTGSERGLLGLEFHPRFAQNGFFFVNYTDRAGDTVVARYRVSNDANLADPASARVILKVAQPFANHNGGQLHFGPDGYLYIGLGDGGSAGDPGNRAQDLTTLLGKMLRIDVDSGDPYAIPAGNPFVGRADARPEIWAYGLRNPWGYSFDRQTGDLWIADVGQGALEEVNLQPASSRGGENYGWKLMEGSACFRPTSGCNNGTLTLPVIEYSHSLGCSITGGFRYRGRTFPRLAGVYLYGDYCSGTLWGASRNAGGGWTLTVLIETGMRISAFGEDERGEVYVINHAGVVYQLNDTVKGRARLLKPRR